MQPCMTLEELKAATHAYDGFRKIDDCDIPDYYKEVFPHKCQCGAEMIMTEPGHTQLQCCNPCCWVKMAHRLAHFTAELGYKGFGEQSALNLFSAIHDRIPFYSFLSVFIMDEHVLALGLSEYYSSLLCDIKDSLKSNPYQFVSIISALGIPNIGSRSTLFDIVKSPMVLLYYILEKKTDELCDMAGIQAPMTRFWLAASAVDIVTLINDVAPNIIDTPKGEVFIAITGKVSVDGKALTRYDFISLCEQLTDANGSPLFKLVETKASDKLQYVIADEPSNSSKYNLGKKLGIITTAQEFYDKLRAEAEKYKSQTEDGE